MMEDHKSLQQIIDIRIQKLHKLREAGIDPYPHHYKPTHKSESIKGDYPNLEGETVRIAGRIMALRKMGKASFFHIQDLKGKIQVFIRRDDVSEDNYNNFCIFFCNKFYTVIC